LGGGRPRKRGKRNIADFRKGENSNREGESWGVFVDRGRKTGFASQEANIKKEARVDFEKKRKRGEEVAVVHFLGAHPRKKAMAAAATNYGKKSFSKRGGGVPFSAEDLQVTRIRSRRYQTTGRKELS